MQGLISLLVKSLLAVRTKASSYQDLQARKLLAKCRLVHREGGFNVSVFFLRHLRLIFERDGLIGGVCVGAAVDGGVWINGEGGAVGDG